VQKITAALERVERPGEFEAMGVREFEQRTP
jgi:hypothetical protein